MSKYILFLFAIVLVGCKSASSKIVDGYKPWIEPNIKSVRDPKVKIVNIR